jgi:hypothetical protein
MSLALIPIAHPWYRCSLPLAHHIICILLPPEYATPSSVIHVVGIPASSPDEERHLLYHRLENMRMRKCDGCICRSNGHDNWIEFNKKMRRAFLKKGGVALALALTDAYRHFITLFKVVRVQMKSKKTIIRVHESLRNRYICINHLKITVEKKCRPAFPHYSNIKDWMHGVKSHLSA